MRKINTEIQPAVCPKCMKGALTSQWMEGIFRCSHCGSGYWHTMSVSSRLERMTVKPVSDISSYPKVSVKSMPYCDCKLRMVLGYGGCLVVPRYCSIHNVIVVEGVFEPEDLSARGNFKLIKRIKAE